MANGGPPDQHPGAFFPGWALRHAGSRLPVPLLARDTFERAVTEGFGAAEVGGLWEVSGAQALYSVSRGKGTIVVPTAGTGPHATLGQVTTDDAEVDVAFSADKLGGGNGLTVGLVVRKVGDHAYRGALRIDAEGRVQAELVRRQPEEVQLMRMPEVAVITPGQELRLRVQARGTNPTLLRLKAWRADAPEPPLWTCQASDSAVPLQGKGSVGLSVYLSPSAMNAPVTVSFDELLVRPASLLP